MAYLNSIVSEINTGLKKSLTAFPTAVYAGIVYQITRERSQKTEVIPAEVNDKGEARWITFDDINELSLYHRIANSTYTQFKNQSYGDGYLDFQHQYDIELVVMGDRRKINVRPDELEAAIASNIGAKEKPTGVSFINVLPVSANHNSQTVFRQEFQGVDYYLKPEHILFSIRYRVELRYQKGCISLCQCD